MLLRVLRLRKLLLRLLVLLLVLRLLEWVRHFRCSGELARRGGDDEECDAQSER